MKEISKPKKKKKLGKSYNWQFWAIIALPMIYAFVFAYIPMGGIIVAFQKYSPRKGILGSEWVGLKYFKQHHPAEKLFSIHYILVFIV